MRKEIGLNDSVMETIIIMSEGNPGAITVLVQLLEDKEKGLFYILRLDDMNIRGTQIWIGYKDYCKQDIENFKTAILKRDPLMIEAINKEGGRGNHPDKAVSNGASYGRRETLE